MGDRESERAEIPDGRYVAVLDRFEELDPADAGGPTERDGNGTEHDERPAERGGRELAVLLMESDDEVVAERAIPTWRLPADARRRDAVLELDVTNGFVVSMAYDAAATERRTDSAQSRFDRLAERPDDDSDESS
ncbi:DUF3006 domain-containing protein [Halorussus gelatinilyticus]|uniref:DUF3006 domain-containing protein n=1 Tax=Halorussus gelatinilyticus TaxID=2937524 RepID=A0A8U0IIH7_9EURY|nr:DUF3006 family protein [Halorussus gelatinilyticus]UPV99888.1 DUF3006 domain-containing protein [Halorussus gelatinilyticus]